MMTFYEPLVEWSAWAWPLLANHLWQATLFFLIVLVICTPLKAAPARVRYSLWLVGLAKFVLPSAAVAWLISRTGIDLASLFTSSGGSTGVTPITPFLSPVASSPVQYIVEPVTPLVGSPTIVHVPAFHDPSDWYGLLTIIWLAGCFLLLGVWLMRRRALSAVIWSGKIVNSGRELETLNRVRSWLGLRREVILVISPRITEPGVWRAFKPVVVLPEGIPDRLSDSELEAVMMHELVHVERWDNLISIPQRVVCCLLWFHPLVWLLDKQLLAEREQSCDDTVIKLSGDAGVYASSIKKVCRHSLGWELTGLSSAAGSDLKKRIKRITGADVNRNPSVMHRAVLCAVATVLILLSAAASIINRGEVTVLSSNQVEGEIDPRFVVAAPEQNRADASAATTMRAPQAPLTQPAGATTLPPTQMSAAPIEIRGPAAHIEVGQPANPREEESPLIFVRQPAPMAIIQASASPVQATHADLSDFVGRYEVDPLRVENFILDITLENGGLWLKPSHADKRKLERTGEMGLTDVYSDFKFTAVEGSKGRVIGLRLDSWDGNVARKLSLPQPSLRGTATFRLRGYSNARIVALAGSFNKWNQSELLFAREGDEWVCRVNLARGKHEYKFIIDGDWITDPSNSKVVSDDRGNRNSQLTID